MIDIYQLIKKIHEIDSVLKKSKQEKYALEFDVNDPDWLKNAEKQSIDFQEEHNESIQGITAELIDFFIESKEQDRRKLWEELSRSEFLQEQIHINRAKEGTREWLFDELLVIIIGDLGNDSRDVLLEINELMKRAQKYDLDIKLAIKPLLKLANSDKSHGQKSMKNILDSVVKSATIGRDNL